MTDVNAAAVPIRSPRMARGAAVQEWRAGWRVIVASLYGYILVSIGMMSMGAFMAPMQQAFHWNRSEFSIGLTALAVVGVIFAPLTGIMIDRYGPRVVAAVGSLMVGGSFALFGTASGSVGYWFALWLVYSVSVQLIMPTTWSVATSAAFTVSRGIAIAVTMAGSGLAALIFPVTANVLIEHFDFRLAFFAMGSVAGLGGGLISWLALPARAPRPRPSAAAVHAEPLAAPGLTVRQGLHSLTFYKLCIALFITNLVIFALVVHLIPLLVAAGLKQSTAALVSSSFGLSLIGAKIVAGFALDRFPGWVVTAVGALILLIAAAMLALPVRGVGWALAAVLVFGAADGALAPTFAYLASRYLGLRSFGRLFGMMSSLYALALAFGPVLAGMVFDLTGSYRLFLIAAIVALLFAIALLATLGRYPDFGRPAPQ